MNKKVWILFSLLARALYVNAAQELPQEASPVPEVNAFEGFDENLVKHISKYLDHTSAGRLRCSCKKFSQVAWSPEPLVITLRYTKKKEQLTDYWKKVFATIQECADRVKRFEGDNEISCDEFLWRKPNRALFTSPLALSALNHLNRCAIRPKEFEQSDLDQMFQAMQNLRSLSLSFILYDQGLPWQLPSSLKKLRKLQELRIINYDFKPKDPASFPEVKTLTLECGWLTDDFSANIRFPSTLRSIRLICLITRGKLRTFLACAPSLEQLSITWGVVPRTFKAEDLNDCINLRELTLDFLHLIFYPHFLDNFPPLKNLKQVNIQSYWHWSESDKAEIRARIPEKIAVTFIKPRDCKP